jgi:hypothetical protein
MNSQKQSICSRLKRRRRWTSGVKWAVLLALIAVSAHVLAQELLPIENVRIPLARYPDGSIHRQLHAGSATMPENGPILAKDVRVETFTPEGKLEMVVEAVDCKYLRREGKVTSAEAVKAEARGIVLTGKGFKWNIKGEQLRVKENVRVEFNRQTTRKKIKK